MTGAVEMSREELLPAVSFLCQKCEGGDSPSPKRHSLRQSFERRSRRESCNAAISVLCRVEEEGEDSLDGLVRHFRRLDVSRNWIGEESELRRVRSCPYQIAQREVIAERKENEPAAISSPLTWYEVEGSSEARQEGSPRFIEQL